MRFRRRRHHVETSDVMKGVLAGLAGGLAATWAMSRIQEAMSRAGGDGGDPSEALGERAVVRGVGTASKNLFHRRLSRSEKRKVGRAVHYGFGSAVGGLYGAAAEFSPRARYGGGTAYGAALWLAGDELGGPALGFGLPPHRKPARTQAAALATHLGFGVVAELVRRGVRRAL